MPKVEKGKIKIDIPFPPLFEKEKEKGENGGESPACTSCAGVNTEAEQQAAPRRPVDTAVENSIPSKGYQRIVGGKQFEIPPNFKSFVTKPDDSSLTLPDIHKYTIPHSPYHITQLLLILLQDFFSTGLPVDYTWKWAPEFEKTKVVFDTSFNKESEAFGKKPIIVVSYGDNTYQRTMVGDNASFAVSRQTAFKDIQKAGISSCTFVCYVVSSLYTESSLIGSLLFNYFISMQHILPRLLGIHNIQTISMSGTSPMRESEQMYLTTISIPVTLQQSWINSVHIDAPRLEAITLLVEEMTSKTGIEIFKEIDRIKEEYIKLEAEAEAEEKAD